MGMRLGGREYGGWELIRPEVVNVPGCYSVTPVVRDMQGVARGPVISEACGEMGLTLQWGD